MTSSERPPMPRVDFRRPSRGAGGELVGVQRPIDRGRCLPERLDLEDRGALPFEAEGDLGECGVRVHAPIVRAPGWDLRARLLGDLRGPRTAPSAVTSSPVMRPARCAEEEAADRV